MGLAAGVDKDGVALKARPALGFGFIELGTVTAHPQPGNPRPRLFRLRASEAVINRMGFNDDGSPRWPTGSPRPARSDPVALSLGKSKVTPVKEAVGDYLTSLRAVHARADYIAVNVSSPTPRGCGRCRTAARFDELLGALTAEAGVLASPDVRDGRPVPVLVKSPDLTDAAIGEVLQVCTNRRWPASSRSTPRCGTASSRRT